MQINLKQTEIEAALRHYISSQGINLTGKTVEIAFTAGRKENGLTAEMQIEESGEIPGFTDYVPAAPLRAVSPLSNAVAFTAPQETEAARAKSNPMTFNEGEPVIPKETAAAVKAVSLFV